MGAFHDRHRVPDDAEADRAAELYVDGGQVGNCEPVVLDKLSLLCFTTCAGQRPIALGLLGLRLALLAIIRSSRLELLVVPVFVLQSE